MKRMTKGVPEQCQAHALDVQADIMKGEPNEVAASAAALARCVTASGGSMANTRGTSVAHKKIASYGYGGYTKMPKLEYGYKPSSAYGYGTRGRN